MLAAMAENSSEAPTLVRYRRPRVFRDLPRSYPRTLRLAARGAMPSRPSLLFTITEVDESKYSESSRFAVRLLAWRNAVASVSPFQQAAPNERTPSTFDAEHGASRKRRAPEGGAPERLEIRISKMCYSAYMAVESLQATLTDDAFGHWKRLRGASDPGTPA